MIYRRHHSKVCWTSIRITIQILEEKNWNERLSGWNSHLQTFILLLLEKNILEQSESVILKNVVF